MPIRVQTPGGIAQFPDGTDPATIESALAKQFPAPESDAPMASHGPEQAPKTLTRGGRDLDALMAESDRLFGDGSGLITAPLQVVGQGPGLVAKALQKIAPGMMRNALGAQQGIRNKFPTVNLDAVALREGAVPGSKRSIAAIGRAAQGANSGIQAAAQAADAAGVAPVQPRQVVGEFRKLFDRAGAARLPEDQSAIVQRANEIRKQYRGGLSRADAIVAKQETADRAKGLLQGAADPRTANIAKKLAKAETAGLTAAAHTDPGVSEALTRSQELMALNKAMKQTGNRTSILRDALATSAGVGVGAMAGGPVGAMITAPLVVAANRAATSPQLLGRMANKMSRAGAQSTGQTERIMRSLLAEIMMANSHEQE